MKENTKSGRRPGIRFSVGQMVLVLLMAAMVFIFTTITAYPKAMKQMFLKSAKEAMEDNLGSVAEFSNQNVEQNYTEIQLLADLISDHLGGSDPYNKNVQNIMHTVKERLGFRYLAITYANSASGLTMLDSGRIVQMDQWVYAMPLKVGEVGVEIHKSPFHMHANEENAVIYQYTFYGPEEGSSLYMLVGEKSADNMEKILSVGDISDMGLTLIVQNNGNILYGKGEVEGQKIDSGNFLSYLEEQETASDRLAEIRENLSLQKSGELQLQIGEMNYWFVYHSIRDTDWICVKAYSEKDMTGEILNLVNDKTMRLVATVVVVLVICLSMIVGVFILHIHRRGEAKALASEKLLTEMSRHIPSAFAIIENNKTVPEYVSGNFYEVLQQDTFDFDSACRWKWAEFSEQEQCDLRQGLNRERIVKKNDIYISAGEYNIGEVNGKEYTSLVCRDVTAEVEAKKLLEDSIRRADEASKAKTSFLSRMSHEIRTPLNAVICYADFAAEGWNTRSQEELLGYVLKIQEAGRYLVDLVSDILDISRIESGRLKIQKIPYSLESLMEEIRGTFQSSMDSKHITFCVKKNLDDSVLMMDRIHLTQILNNLISNACKFTEEGGHVTVTVDEKRINEKKVSILFTVEDDGIGMSEEYQKILFEPFTQENRDRMMRKQLRGSGLGMAICRNLVNMQDGTIRVTSTPGKGTRFEVRMVFDIAEAIFQGNTRGEITETGCLKGRKILVVDDVPMNREVIRIMLEKYCVDIDEAEDGEECLKMLCETKKNEYLAILMDVQMPGMDGYETAERIRKLEREDLRTIPMAAVTADAFSEDEGKALASGMNYHIAKPIAALQLVQVLIEICHKNDRN